jgi:exonuclease III
MKEVHLDILGICETRWAGNGDFTQDDVWIIYSRSEKSGKNGVAVILRGKWKENVLNTYYVDDRTMMIKLQAALTNIYTIQVYFPTYNSSDEEINVMYGKLEELMSLTKKKSYVFILGDFNASVEEQTSTSIHMGKYEFGN